MTPSPKKTAGFTLIELLVVIAVIGVLVAVTVPAVSSARDRGRATATVAEVASYETAASTYLAEMGEFPVPDSADIAASCYEYDTVGGVNQNPRFCCVADQPCTYAGRQLAPLSRGPFAPRAGVGGPMRGALPRFPRLPAAPVAAGPLQYRGVFHSCNDAACQRPNVTWTQPAECPAGMTRNGVTGLCQREISRVPVATVGQSETYCYNGADDEGDGLVDCADDDCDGRARCGNETSQERCEDEFDNDGDGEIDCDDADCACDGVELVCDDSIDNDGDLSADCADSDCDGALGPNGETCQPSGESSCVDTYDNDGDGNIDCLDTDCSTHVGCTPVCVPQGVTESDCSLISGDEDCDGDSNCADSDCAYLSYCGGSELGQCTDGLDNDMDGSYDCGPSGDSDCTLDPSCGE
jgi:prepilin-type N-terminal cleavage/methylation domain-containing protein